MPFVVKQQTEVNILELINELHDYVNCILKLKLKPLNDVHW